MYVCIYIWWHACTQRNTYTLCMHTVAWMRACTICIHTCLKADYANTSHAQTHAHTHARTYTSIHEYTHSKLHDARTPDELMCHLHRMFCVSVSVCARTDAAFVCVCTRTHCSRECVPCRHCANACICVFSQTTPYMLSFKVYMNFEGKHVWFIAFFQLVRKSVINISPVFCFCAKRFFVFVKCGWHGYIYIYIYTHIHACIMRSSHNHCIHAYMHTCFWGR